MPGSRKHPNLQFSVRPKVPLVNSNSTSSRLSQTSVVLISNRSNRPVCLINNLLLVLNSQHRLQVESLAQTSPQVGYSAKLQHQLCRLNNLVCLGPLKRHKSKLMLERDFSVDKHPPQEQLVSSLELNRLKDRQAVSLVKLLRPSSLSNNHSKIFSDRPNSPQVVYLLRSKEVL